MKKISLMRCLQRLKWIFFSAILKWKETQIDYSSTWRFMWVNVFARSKARTKLMLVRNSNCHLFLCYSSFFNSKRRRKRFQIYSNSLNWVDNNSEKILYALALENFPIPGDPKFVLGGMVSAPANRTDAGTQSLPSPIHSLTFTHSLTITLSFSLSRTMKNKTR
jgi:hypothetical protein